MKHFTPSQLAKITEAKTCTVKAKLAAFQIQPDDFSSNGTPLYGERALRTLENQRRAERSILKAGRDVLYGSRLQTSIIQNAS